MTMRTPKKAGAGKRLRQCKPVPRELWMAYSKVRGTILPSSYALPESFGDETVVKIHLQQGMRGIGWKDSDWDVIRVRIVPLAAPRRPGRKGAKRGS